MGLALGANDLSGCEDFDESVYSEAYEPRRIDRAACPPSRRSTMRFTLIDQIQQLEVGNRIVASKNLSLAEEYLADHFPGFPVMPGVLMLETMTQAGAWLVRATEDFQHSIVVLKEARNVKYGNFVQPGQTLVVTVEIVDRDDHEVRLKASGTVGEQTTVSARLTLVRYNLADREPHKLEVDQVIKANLRQQFAQLHRVPAVA